MHVSNEMTHRPEKHHFTIDTGAKTRTVHGRGRAVDVAKTESCATRRDVVVERDDGMVRMTFRQGALLSLVSEVGSNGRHRR